MYDNASAEILLSRYKAELLEGSAFRDLTEAQMETSDYIERYYNPVRRHSAWATSAQTNMSVRTVKE